MQKVQPTEIITVSKIRFGDPVSAISIGPNSIMHGSIMGRLCYYQFATNTERELRPDSEEIIRDITLSQDKQTYYAIVGDAKYLRFQENGISPLAEANISSNYGSHTETCDRAFSFGYENKCCVMFLEAEGDSKEEENKGGDYRATEYMIIHTDMLEGTSSSTLRELQIIPTNSIPCDYNGTDLAWMYCRADEDKKDFEWKILAIYNLPEKRVRVRQKFPESIGYISHLKIKGPDTLIMVINHQQLITYDILSKETKPFGMHKSTIISLSINTLPGPATEVVSMDEDGCIKVHHEGKLMKEIQLSQISYKGAFLDPVEIFGMGYPYLIKKTGNIICFSSDEGVFVLRIA